MNRRDLLKSMAVLPTLELIQIPAKQLNIKDIAEITKIVRPDTRVLCAYHYGLISRQSMLSHLRIE